MEDKIVDHKTMRDGTHEPLLESEANAILAACDAAKKKRTEDMPTEQDALKTLFSAYQRLKELGWREAIYCPKDGTMFDAIEVGSTGIHDCNYIGEWPDGKWYVYDGDMWSSRPILFRLKGTPNDEKE